MCGITGWANLDSHTPPAAGAKELLHAMCERMVHRGPDSEGLFATTGVALGMRRLAIIDLVTGEQPVFNEDRSVAVVLNGEIYNYRELRADLEKRGITFAAGPLTQVDGDERVGLIVIRASSPEEARKIADADPEHIHKARTYKLYRWMLNEGQISLKVNLSEQKILLE